MCSETKTKILSHHLSPFLVNSKTYAVHSLVLIIKKE